MKLLPCPCASPQSYAAQQPVLSVCLPASVLSQEGLMGATKVIWLKVHCHGTYQLMV